MEFKLIVCLNYNNSIGNRLNNDLIFNIPLELKHFKKITTESKENMINVLVMGKHTWNSLPKKPLPNRMNFIISSNYETINYEYRDHHNVSAFPNHETCLSYIDDNKTIFDTTFIIGGISIYEYYLNHNIITQIICTKITSENNYGDIFFNPDYFNFFKLNHYETFNNIESHNNITHTNMMINYSVCNYLKISKINPNLIYNKSLYLNFTDSENSSIDNTDSEYASTIISSNDKSNDKSKTKSDANTDLEYDCDIGLYDLDSISNSNSFNEYDKNILKKENNKSNNSFYISDSDNDSDSERDIKNKKDTKINYSYSMSSLESIQVDDYSERMNENIIHKIKSCQTLNETDECNEWTFINRDDCIVKKNKIHHTNQYLKYYYSIHNKINNEINNEMNNEMNLYNNKTLNTDRVNIEKNNEEDIKQCQDSDNETYYF